ISRVSAETGQVTALQPVLLETYARAEGRRPSGRRAQRWTVSGHHREGEALLRGCDRRWHLRVPPNARLRQRAVASILTQQRRPLGAEVVQEAVREADNDELWKDPAYATRMKSWFSAPRRLLDWRHTMARCQALADMLEQRVRIVELEKGAELPPELLAAISE